MRSALLLPLMSLTIALALAHGTSLAQDHVEIDPRQVLAEFDIYKDGDWILLPVEIAGKTYRFVVGTGFTYTALDTSLAGLLGTPVATDGTGINLYLEPNGKVGKMSLQTGQPARTADLTHLRKASGHAIDGVLGMSFLSTKVVHLDFDRGKLYFLRSRCTQAGESCPLHFNLDNLPLVDVDVPGAGTRQFLLSTGQGGCGSGALDRQTFADLLRNGLMTGVGQIWSASLNRAEMKQRGEIRGLSLGPISLPPMIFNESASNVLGLGFLLRFKVTFDFPGRRLYLAKSRHFDLPDRIDRSGLHVLREHGVTIVAVVDQGSPAEASGIRPGDVLTEVDGKNVGQLRMKPFRQLLAKSEAIPVTIRRGQKQIVVTLGLGAWSLKQKACTEGARPDPSIEVTPGAAREHE
jgi:hypothetical protein